MKLLQLYLLRQNLIYLCACLLACVGVYLLIDVFDRLDHFLERDASLDQTLLYFGAKMPLILSQILPGVFLLALIVHLGMMRKDREIMALEAGGVPYSKLVVFFLLYSVIWALLQLFFSQVLGVAGDIKSEKIWDSAGSKEQPVRERTVTDLWFKEGRRIIYIQDLQPKSGQGRGIKIYELGQDFQDLQRIIQAQEFRVQARSWELSQVEIYDPRKFESRSKNSHNLQLDRSIQAFIESQARESPEEMTIWELKETIRALQSAGSNVQHLQTAWHMKLAYAFSIPVLALLALAVSRTWENMFLNICLGLGLTFIFYMLHVLGGSLGEKRILAPLLGGWLGNYLLGFSALFWLGIKLRSRG
ncbi:MAG: LptF/LptG family permease [Desulfohalobiaceae bacterium]